MGTLFFYYTHFYLKAIIILEKYEYREGSVVSRDGVYILKGVDAGDVGTGKEFQLYLDYMYDYDIDNIGMTIELTWVYDND